VQTITIIAGGTLAEMLGASAAPPLAAQSVRWTAM